MISMVERVYLDNNEYSHYPLKNPSTVYPDGLLSDISILVPSQMYRTCVSSVTCKNGYVSVIFTGYSHNADEDGTSEPYGYCYFMPNKLAIATIYASSDNRPIGWLSYGSIAKTDGVYQSEEDIMDSCTVIDMVVDSVSTVNKMNYTTPENLDIVINGDIDYSKGNITYWNTFSSTSLLTPDPVIYGGITSINGTKISDKDNALIIQLPGIITSDNKSPVIPSKPGIDPSKMDIFTADLVGVLSDDDDDNNGHRMPNRVYSIKITPTEFSKEVYDNNVPPFTCPNSDILLDKIFVNGIDVKFTETPLDDFIRRYRTN